MNMFLSHWSANPVVLAACGVVAVTYLLGALAGQRLSGRANAVGRPSGQGSTARSAAHAVAFGCGLLLVVVALVSPLAYWSREYIWIRSLQDVILAFGAPSLIVLAAPWLTLRRGGAVLLRRAGTAGRPDAPGAGQQDRRPDRPPAGWSWTSWPVVITVAFNICWLAWHVPGGYDGALRHPVVYAAEVVSYLALGIAFWLQVTESPPFTLRFAPLGRLALAMGTFVCVSALSMVLIFGSAVMYPAYRGPAHRAFSVLTDQGVGGATMWAVALVPFGIAVIALCMRWLAADESEALDTDFDRLLRRPTSGWPSRPGFR